ncbi:calcium-binding protein, partial [Pseudomonas capeferrum]|uniref:calcium-binding protein n=1 Tax=Pseudomonas capeferrum TaxID=1495066 RepID=UPI0030D8F160
MSLPKSAERIIVNAFLNGSVGAKFIGVGAFVHSEPLGGYIDPDSIENYKYNPSDGNWYAAPPPYPGARWREKATHDKKIELDARRDLYIQHNEIEGRSLDDPDIKADPSLVRIALAIVKDLAVDGHLKNLVSRINIQENELYRSALNFVLRRDPLALDLDGDGIETVSANSGIVFDFNGDGLKTGTGWVKGDDGFLVLDRDGNGSIDNGNELFGVDTIKANGNKATDGFDALSDLDSNSDSVFDAQDEQFSNVRVWQDQNQDGIAQTIELKSLAEHDITAINLGFNAVRHDTNGNLIRAVGTFVRADGSEGALNGNQSLAANLDLATNPFYREYTDTVPLHGSVEVLPNMGGSGSVRDLQEAAMLNEGLRSVLTQYSRAATRAEQLSKIDKLLAEWASTSNFRTFDQLVGDLNFTRGLEGIEFEFSYSWEKPESAFEFSTGSSSGGGGSGNISGAPTAEGDTGPTPEQLAKKTLLEKIKVLEVFNGQSFFGFTKQETPTKDGGVSISVGFSLGSTTRSSSGSLGLMPSGTRAIYITEEDLALGPGQIELLNNAYEVLVKSVYNGLLLQTRLKSYVDSVELEFSEAGLSLNYEGLVQRLVDVGAADPVRAIIDSGDLRQAMPNGPDYSKLGSLTEYWLEQLSNSQMQSLTQQLGGQVLQNGEDSGTLTGGVGVDFLLGRGGNDTLNSGAGDDFLSGGAGNNSLNGGNGNDLLLGGEGNDNLKGGAGDDILYGGTGNDYLYGSNGNDLVLGGEGADQLYGDAGDDLLDGGAGNDALNGGAGSDIYRFARGWGQDTINNYDQSTGKTDAIEFSDVASGDVTVSRSTTDLILSLKGSTDRVTISNYFRDDGTSAYKLEEIRFADGKSWSIEQVKTLVLTGTDGNDTVRGFATDDVMDGGSGNDYLYGENGNDTLKGGAGNDVLYGGNGNDLVLGGEGADQLYGDAGDDLLDGGAGNDALNGGAGSDIYRFARGW